MLTEKQQQTFKENIRLAGWLAQRYRCPLSMDREDWFQEVCLCLIQAIQWHDPEKGTIARLANRLVWNRHSCLVGMDKRQKKRAKLVSIDAENSDDATISEMMTDYRHQDCHEILAVQEQFASVVTGLDQRQSIVCQGVAQGLSWREIGDGMGLSGEAVRQTFIRLRESLNPQANSNEVVRHCQMCERTMIITRAASTRRFCKPCSLRRERELGRELRRIKKLEGKVAG